MEQKNLGYSLKNIPIPGKNAYLKCLVERLRALSNVSDGKRISLKNQLILKMRAQILNLVSNQTKHLRKMNT